MSLKPIDKRTKFDTRDTLWAEIRARKTFTISDLYGATHMARQSIRPFVVGLCNARIVEQRGERESRSSGPDAAKLYHLIKDIGSATPRIRKDGTLVTQGNSRRQIWATMRILGTFDSCSLAITASTEECPVAASETAKYCQALAKAGYLKVIAGGKGNTPATYRLLPHRYTGPKPPQIQRVKSIYDPNLKKVVWDSMEGRHD
jgi:hypothetical protein